MLPDPFIDVGEYYLLAVREVVAPSFHHVSRWCTYIFWCVAAFDWVGAGRTKHAKPVLSKSKEQGDILTGVDHASRQTCLGQERDFGGYELCGTRASVGKLALCYMLKV